tara:strand:- start:3019 stop:3702 length:684 start_codon:yes stop_codon:yes gene_type:complete
MNIAVIPARGGSKRIPKKNIKLFNGKPIIAYSIEAALTSECFDTVIVSTDDNEIAKIATKYGAQVPFMRPDEISDDHATTLDVMKHAIDWCNKNHWQVKKLCCIYATAPFILPEDIRLGLSILEQEQASYVFSATSFAFPIQRAFSIDKKDNINMFLPENLNVRSQDLPTIYHDAGQFYWGTAHSFQTKQPVFSIHSKIVRLPRKRVQDIDTLEDWEIAEALFKVIG